MKPTDFIKLIFPRKKQSVWIAVLGKKQSGKTDFCLYLMEKLHELGLMDGFGSNVPVEAPFEVDFIEDFQTLKRHCQMLNPDPKARGIRRYYFFGSEMGKWLPRDQAYRNVDFIEELQTVRKYGLNWVGDAISRVDKRALNEVHFEGAFTKLSPTNPTVAIWKDWSNGQETLIRNIPRTTIKFDTWYSANFYMEPQTDSELSNVPLNKEHKMIQEYLETKSWDKTEHSRKEGQRAVFKVLRFHMDHCLNSLKDVEVSE